MKSVKIYKNTKYKLFNHFLNLLSFKFKHSLEEWTQLCHLTFSRKLLGTNLSIAWNEVSNALSKLSNPLLNQVASMTKKSFDFSYWLLLELKYFISNLYIEFQLYLISLIHIHMNCLLMVSNQENIDLYRYSHCQHLLLRFQQLKSQWFYEFLYENQSPGFFYEFFLLKERN